MGAAVEVLGLRGLRFRVQVLRLRVHELGPIRFRGLGFRA